MGFEKQISQNVEEEKQNGFQEKLGRVSRHCGIFLLGALMEFTSIAQSQDFTRVDSIEKKETTENNISYRSQRSEKELKKYEHLYPDFKGLKMPIVVGNFDEELEKFSKDARVSYEILFGHVGAMAFPGFSLPKEGQKTWHMSGDTVYIIYGTKLDEVPLGRRIGIPFHEGLHAKHFAEQIERNPSDTTGYMRYPELSLEVNKYIEELITGFKTIQWLEEEGKKEENSVFSKEEKEVLLQALEKEREYFLNNYYDYYHFRHGSNFEIPAGEGQTSDVIDAGIEDMFKAGGIAKALRTSVEKMSRREN